MTPTPTAPATSDVDSGPIHFDCWEEHHSDPTGTWPPDHACPLDDDEATT